MIYATLLSVAFISYLILFVNLIHAAFSLKSRDLGLAFDDEEDEETNTPRKNRLVDFMLSATTVNISMLAFVVALALIWAFH